MTAQTQKKVEAIFPLTVMQQAFLFHHLQDEKDQGLLLVELGLSGQLNIEFLKEAWLQTAQRHTVLRTSVHWEKLKKPVQVIHTTAKQPFEIYDWSNLTKTEVAEKTKALKNKRTLNLSKAPVADISLVRISSEKYILWWHCHHLLLDGWSASNIIKDLFAFYDALSRGSIAILQPIPTYKAYFSWLKGQEEEKAKKFWKSALKMEAQPTLFEPQTTTKATTNFVDHPLALSTELTTTIKKYARQNGVTVSTILKSIWAILLNKYFGQKTVTFGTTVSGRSIDLPNIDLMAGLFMNVLPVQIEVQPNSNCSDWLKKVQSTQGKAISYEHNTLNQILSWVKPKYPVLFDSLLVFENFPWENFKSGGLTIEDFKGGLTTTYPLTIIVKPLENYVFTFRYKEDVVTKETISWFAGQMEKLLELLTSSAHLSVEKATKALETSPTIGITQNFAATITKKQFDYVAPSNELELKFTRLWEEVLGYSPIGVTDHFFQIGGKSLHAVRLLSRIEDELGYNLPPVTLLKNPTIKALAKVVLDKKALPTWSSVVPLRASGSKPPIFCIHGGGGHVFFYNILTKYLDPEQPVYSIQPLGFDSEMDLHQSIEEMAADYLKEMKLVQPKGSYRILTYCFSQAVGIEISRQLQAEGNPPPLFIVMDSSPRVYVNTIPDTKERFQRFLTLSPQQITGAVFKKIEKRIENLKKKWKKAMETKQERGFRLVKENLDRLYDNYKWTPFTGVMTYIRSTEFAMENEHLRVWNKLAADGLDIYVVEGHHKTLFEEPEVQGVAKQLQICLDDFSQQTGK